MAIELLNKEALNDPWRLLVGRRFCCGTNEEDDSPYAEIYDQIFEYHISEHFEDAVKKAEFLPFAIVGMTEIETFAEMPADTMSSLLLDLRSPEKAPVVFQTGAFGTHLVAESIEELMTGRVEDEDDEDEIGEGMKTKYGLADESVLDDYIGKLARAVE